MDRTVREHIARLEQRLRELNSEIMDDTKSQSQRNRIEAEIRAAELALDYYRKALDLERQISA
jgi:hypothetical protein